MHRDWSCVACGRPRDLADQLRAAEGLPPLGPGAVTCGGACAGVLGRLLVSEAQSALDLAHERLGTSPSRAVSTSRSGRGSGRR